MARTDLDASEQRGYTSFFPKAPKDLKFETDFKFHLVSTLEEFKSLTDGLSEVRVAYDCETKGLDDTIPEPMVGFSWATDPYTAYYVPMRHQLGTNVDPKKVLPELVAFLKRNKILVFNGAFEWLMLEAEGFRNISEDIRSFEVMALVFNADTSVKSNGLKESALHYLGRSSPTFEETVGKSARFDVLHPDEAVYYASLDAANTFGLYNVLSPALLKECPTILKVDNCFAKSLPYLLKSPVYMDNEVMSAMASDIRKEIRRLETAVFRAVGHVFQMDSRQQLGQALLSIGLDTGALTDTGNMKTDEDSMSRIDHPVAKMIVERNSLVKQLSSYVEKLAKIPHGRVQWQAWRVPTGRLASGNKESKNTAYLPLNYQNLTKPVVAFYKAEESQEPDNILGWRFTMLSDIKQEDGSILTVKEQMKIAPPGTRFIEGMDPALNVRRGITVSDPKKYYFVACDFSQEELYVAGMLSRDPIMMDAFDKGEDLHKKVAIEMFGKEAYSKEKRQKAKIANFGLLYDGTSFTLMKSSGLSQSECEEIYQRYWETMKVLRQWKRRQKSTTYQRGGNVYTAFGRPRRLKFYLSHSVDRMKKFGERSITSHEIQGSCGDVMRIVLYNLWRKLYTKRPDEIRFIGTVHDEIDQEIRKDSFDEVIRLVIQEMQITLPGQTLKLEATVSVGTSYGSLFPFILDKATDKWIPQFV